MNESLKEKRISWILLFSGIVCISVSAIFVKKAGINGISSAFYRMLFATLAILPFYLRSRNKSMDWKGICFCLLGGVFFGIELAFWNVAVMISNATFPTLIVNLSSVWVGIGAMILFREKLNRFHWIGNAAALLGVAILIGIGSILNMRVDRGFLFSIAASVFLAAYVLAVKQVRRKHSTLQVVFFTFLSCTITLLVCSIATGSPFYGFSPQTWIYLLCLGLVTQVGGYFSINYSLGHIDSSKVSLLTLIQPILTAVFAVILLNESFQLHQLAGGCLVLAGLVIAVNIRPALFRNKSTPKTEAVNNDS